MPQDCSGYRKKASFTVSICTSMVCRPIRNMSSRTWAHLLALVFRKAGLRKGRSVFLGQFKSVAPQGLMLSRKVLRSDEVIHHKIRRWGNRSHKTARTYSLLTTAYRLTPSCLLNSDLTHPL